MNSFRSYCVFFLLVTLYGYNALFCLEQSDRMKIEYIIDEYVNCWNTCNGVGFADNFSEDADFVNIFGDYFSGRLEIENRHIDILKTFLKGSILTVKGLSLREVSPGLVIALVRWELDGTKSSDDFQGIFTHVFFKTGSRWEITATQNTRKIPNLR